LRSGPFLWVTWLTRLLAGEDQCEWALWFLTRHQIPKEPKTDLDRKRDQDHARLVTERVAELESQGLNVNVESQNRLSYVGASDTKMTGIPDIAIVEPDKLTYEDCKTGKRRPEHHAQVLLYAQLARQNKIAKPIFGRLVYATGVEAVDMTRRDEIRDGFIALMGRVNAGTAPRVPSFSNCRYCKVKAYCDERIVRDDRSDARDHFENFE
jgi:CRISPR/Cas system-associated exonuclease Cas4 (RecB family)